MNDHKRKQFNNARERRVTTRDTVKNSARMARGTMHTTARDTHESTRLRARTTRCRARLMGVANRHRVYTKQV